ncbi:hypothetical protein KMW28_22715 [Flammeovirga yaeyamensis]|uniref:Uncharacterized protein n=1 Tax=Flammeovirga yaeyamensis TaxID=367791 RepID=A0AAX1NCH9_9BACT|nr:hypothetical protein [Flammeovirga yaeyamensis]MBB3696825.1 hypothetical protein [Flammeovirga yaeyamensis]NMF33490.1 hypothetical protein [Flammeovirga yaeyamensis]QWG05236.1 hypothetical protein KMW28_22715 [Flammeovirga yaeyamensis]
MIAIIAQTIISSISIPTEAQNINIHLLNGEVVSISKAEWKRGKKYSDENTIVYKRKKEYFEVHKDQIDYVQYESLDTYEKTVDFMSEYARINDLDEHVLNYYHTKRHKNSRTSQTFAVGAWTIGALANPWFLAVAPLPTSQAVKHMKGVDYQYVLRGKEWRECKKRQKEKVKSLKAKAKALKESKN